MQFGNSRNPLKNVYQSQELGSRSTDDMIAQKMAEIKVLVDKWRSIKHLNTLDPKDAGQKFDDIIKYIDKDFASNAILGHKEGSLLKQLNLDFDYYKKDPKVLNPTLKEGEIKIGNIIAEVKKSNHNKQERRMNHCNVFQLFVSAILCNVDAKGKSEVQDFPDNCEQFKKFYNDDKQYQALLDRIYKQSYNARSTEEAEDGEYVDYLMNQHDRQKGKLYTQELKNTSNNNRFILEARRLFGNQKFGSNNNVFLQQIINAIQSRTTQSTIRAHLDLSDGSLKVEDDDEIENQMKHLIALYEKAREFKQRNNGVLDFDKLPNYLRNPAPTSSFKLLGNDINEMLSRQQYDFVTKLNEAFNNTNGANKITAIDLNLLPGEGKSHLTQIIEKNTDNAKVIIKNYNKNTSIQEIKNDANAVKGRQDRQCIIFIDESAHCNKELLDAITEYAMTLKQNRKNVALVNITATPNQQYLKHQEALAGLIDNNNAHQDAINEELQQMSNDAKIKIEEHKKIINNIKRTDIKNHPQKRSFDSDCSEKSIANNIQKLINDIGRKNTNKQIQYIMPEHTIYDTFIKKIAATGPNNTYYCTLAKDNMITYCYKDGNGQVFNSKAEKEGLMRITSNNNNANIITFFDTESAVGGDFGEHLNSNIDRQFLHLDTVNHTNDDLTQYLSRNRSVKLQNESAKNVSFVINNNNQMSWKSFIEDNARKDHILNVSMGKRKDEIVRNIAIKAVNNNAKISLEQINEIIKSNNCNQAWQTLKLGNDKHQKKIFDSLYDDYHKNNESPEEKQKEADAEERRLALLKQQAEADALQQQAKEDADKLQQQAKEKEKELKLQQEDADKLQQQAKEKEKELKLQQEAADAEAIRLAKEKAKVMPTLPSLADILKGVQVKGVQALNKEQIGQAEGLNKGQGGKEGEAEEEIFDAKSEERIFNEIFKVALQDTMQSGVYKYFNNDDFLNVFTTADKANCYSNTGGNAETTNTVITTYFGSSQITEAQTLSHKQNCMFSRDFQQKYKAAIERTIESTIKERHDEGPNLKRPDDYTNILKYVEELKKQTRTKDMLRKYEKEKLLKIINECRTER